MDSAHKVRVAINGFGRIGRNAFKVALEEHANEIEIVGLNDLTDPKVLAHLLEYDTAYGHWDKEVSSTDQPTTVGTVTSKGSLVVEGQNIPIFAEKDPKSLPWKELNVDVVIESTGRFTDEEGMKQHITAGAKKVVLSAPAKDANVGTFLIGVNHDKYQGQVLINNASCTSNCLAPVIAIIHEKFGIAKALYTTVHSVTAEQNLVDGPPPGGKSTDLRRARAAYANMIPTTTGAAVAVTQAIPELEGFMDGRAIRVPTIVGSITDFTVLLKRKTTVGEINQTIKDACNTDRWKGIVTWTEEPLVSSDIIGRSESSIVDLELTQVVDGDLVKIFAWYDNEWGYSNRLIEQVINVGKGSPQLLDNSHQTSQIDSSHTFEPTLSSSPIFQTQAELKTTPTGFVSPLPPLAANQAPLPQESLSLPPANPTSTLVSRITPIGSHPDASPPPPPSNPLILPPSDGHPPLEPRGFFTHDSTPQPLTSGFHPSDSSVNHVIPPSETPVPPMTNPVVAHSSLSPAAGGATPPSNPATPLPSMVTPITSKANGKPADEPKIEDHIITPEEAEHRPKNNPFLSWFK